MHIHTHIYTYSYLVEKIHMYDMDRRHESQNRRSSLIKFLTYICKVSDIFVKLKNYIYEFPLL